MFQFHIREIPCLVVLAILCPMGKTATASGRCQTSELVNFYPCPTWPEQNMYTEDEGPIDLLCSVISNSGTVNLTWYKDGIELKSDQHIYISNDKQRLIIELPVQKDSGYYSCNAAVTNSSIRYEGYILVTESISVTHPRIVHTEPLDQEQKVILGSSTNISCTFDVGSQKSTPDKMQWRKDGDLLYDNNTDLEYQIFNLTRGQTVLMLQIRNISRLPPVAFDSAISELPHMKFESITINKGRHRTYIKANAKMNKKQYFDYRSTWFVDNIPVNSYYIKNKDFISYGASEKYVDDGRLISFDLLTSLTPTDIANKTFKVIVSYEQGEFLHLKKKKESRRFYSYQNYEITFKGSDLGFTDATSPQTYNFEFFLAKQSSTRKYRGMFGFTYDSDSSVNEITTSFEGFGIKTKPPRYVYDIAKRDGNTTLISFSEMSVPPLSNKLKIVHIDLVEDTKKGFHGLFKESVSTTNRLKVDIKYVFELTSYLYNGLSLKEPFFPLTGLIITNFEESGNAEKTTLICRVFGFRNAKVKLFLRTTKSDDREEVTKNVIPTYNEYETDKTLVFVENSDRQAGTYFCVATACLFGEKVFKVEKRRTMFLS